jgi:hypothetical protein
MKKSGTLRRATGPIVADSDDYLGGVVTLAVSRSNLANLTQCEIGGVLTIKAQKICDVRHDLL